MFYLKHIDSNKPNLDLYAKKTGIDNKVDRIDGKMLSSNDFMDAEIKHNYSYEQSILRE